MSKVDLLSDKSNCNLKHVPFHILEMTNLKMLYLESNVIENLPDDLFERLPHLEWLDLRNNMVRAIPATVGKHKHLETFLLENNCVEFLPNELGLVQSLKVLQLQGNPLRYPSKDIIKAGVKAIVQFLQREYTKLQFRQELVELAQPQTPPQSSNATLSKSEVPVIQDVLKRANTNVSLSQAEVPYPVTVKSLSKIEEESEDGTRHTIMRNCPKFVVKSRYTNKKLQGKMKTKKGSDMDMDAVKQVWMLKLREILTEQERLIQQEKNLATLNEWRSERKMEPERLPSAESIVIPPYATESEHAELLSRADLHKEFNWMAKRRTFPANDKAYNRNIDKVMEDVLNQLRAIENKMTDGQSPRTKMMNSEREIRAILELHKKIATVQARNNAL